MGHFEVTPLDLESEERLQTRTKLQNNGTSKLHRLAVYQNNFKSIDGNECLYVTVNKKTPMATVSCDPKIHCYTRGSWPTREAD